MPPRVSSFWRPLPIPRSDAADAVPRNSLHACACARLTESFDKLCPLRQTVFTALVGRFMQSRRQISRNPAPALSFRAWPFFVQPGCKLANRVRTQVHTFCVATIPHRPAMSGLSPASPRSGVRTANPANLIFCSDGGAMLRLRPPYWNIARKDPFCLGHMCVRRP